MMGAEASFTISTLTLGDHQITAVYSGDSTFANSTSYTLTETVGQVGIITWLS